MRGRAVIGGLVSRRSTRLALAAIALGAVLRALWVFEIHPPPDYLFSDMAGYIMRAIRFASDAPLIRYDAFYPPGTHMLLAVPFELVGTGRAGLWAAAALWWGLSAITPLLVWALAVRLMSAPAAALSAGLAALYPLFIFYAGFFTSETPALAFLVAALALGYAAPGLRGRRALVAALGAGLAGGAAVAIRPQFLLNLAVVGLPAIWHFRRDWRLATAGVVGLLAVIAPVVSYNSAATGRLTGLNENGGLLFFQGQCDVQSVSVGGPRTGRAVLFANPVALRLRRGVAYRFPDRDPWDERFFYDRGLRCIRRAGIGHVGRLARNVVDSTATTPPWPLLTEPTLLRYARVTNTAYSIALALIAAALTLLAVRRRRGRSLPGMRNLLLHLLLFVPVAAVFSAEPRYRVPYDVFGLMLVSLLAAAALEKVRAVR